MIGTHTIGTRLVGSSGDQQPPTIDPSDVALAQIVTRSATGPVVGGAVVRVYTRDEEGRDDELADIWRPDGTFIDQRGDFDDAEELTSEDDSEDPFFGTARFLARGGVYNIEVENDGEIARWDGYRMGLAEARDVGPDDDRLPTSEQSRALTFDALDGAPEADSEPTPEWVLVLQDGEWKRASIEQLQGWLND